MLDIYSADARLFSSRRHNLQRILHRDSSLACVLGFTRERKREDEIIELNTGRSGQGSALLHTTSHLVSNGQGI